MDKNDLELWRKTPEFYERLVEEYSRELELDSASYIFVPLTAALLKLGRVGEASSVLAKGLKEHPKNRAGKVLMAQIFYKQGDLNRSRLVLEKVVKNCPDLVRAVTLLCKIYDKTGAQSKAEDAVRRLADYYPESRKIKRLLKKYVRTPEVKEPLPVAETPEEPTTEAEDDNQKIVDKLEEMLFRISRLKENGSDDFTNNNHEKA
jgi:predicted Zn-dependent protease